MSGTNGMANNGLGGQPYAPAHPSRRDNQSISSTTSRGSDRERGERARANTNPPVESAVTRLLVSIKQLLEALTLWSTQKMSEVEVSDVYVRLGNDFNAAVAAFRSFNIDMSELLTVPDDLRSILETCLSEDATPSNLEIYLPTVRQIITNLLQGLRSKQSIYRRLTTDKKQRSSESRVTDRESRATRSSRADSMSSSNGARIQQSRSITGTESSNRSSMADGHQRRVVSSSSRRSEVASPPPVPPPVDENYFPGGFARSRTPGNEEGRSIGHRRERSRATDSGSSGPGSETQERASTPRLSETSNEDPNDRTLTMERSPTPLTQAPTAASPVVPASVPRYSLTDPPVPAVVVDDATPQPSESGSSASLDRQASAASTVTETPPDTPPIDVAQAPAIANSLAALKKSDTLERRASKRFSTYNISKMTGTGLRERSGMSRGMARRSMAAGATNLTPGELNVLTEEDESGSDAKQSLQTGTDYFTRTSRTPSPSNEHVPPMPVLPKKPPSIPEESVTGKGKEKSIAGKAGETVSEESTSNILTVFLQVGREVKKVSIERGLSFSSLRVLFVDKFSYSPGQGNFPDIYIRDPSSGVMYELEDVEEVKDKCLLSLNIDPLDQIKQHIDSQMTGLAQELKELRSSVGTSKRLSQLPTQQPIIAQPFPESEAQVNRPSDKQFQRIARRLSRLVTTPEEPPGSIQSNGILAQATGSTMQPQWTGGSILSESSSRIVSDLKTQFDEVQNLRRDLGVMRQMYVDFMTQTKESLGSLRSQAQAVRQISTSKVGGARSYVNAGKASLDQRTQTVLTRVEELQDTVENLKDDVLKRFVSPRSNVVKTVAKDIAEVSAELESLKEYMSTVKPMWKKTWEEELQNIVEEQQFLTHQEEFMQDLLEDQKALVEVFGHVEKVISLRGSGAGRTKPFRPPAQEESHGGITTVMMEIRNAAINPERRLKAIAANQKSREREKANAQDEFEAELKGFVSGKKLKMTGGADEIERVRQKRNDLALKAMFNSSQNGGSTSSTTTPTSATFSSEQFGSDGSSSPQN